MEKPNSLEDNLNPWDVTSYQDFLFYNCPECQFKVKNQIEFHQHAIENHVKALNLSWKLYSKRPNTDQRKYDMIRKKAVVCKQCDTRCGSKNGLRLHIQSAKCQNVEPMTITGESDFDETLSCIPEANLHISLFHSPQFPSFYFHILWTFA